MSARDPAWSDEGFGRRPRVLMKLYRAVRGTPVSLAMAVFDALAPGAGAGLAPRRARPRPGRLGAAPRGGRCPTEGPGAADATHGRASVGVDARPPRCAGRRRRRRSALASAPHQDRHGEPVGRWHEAASGEAGADPRPTGCVRWRPPRRHLALVCFPAPDVAQHARRAPTAQDAAVALAARSWWVEEVPVTTGGPPPITAGAGATDRGVRTSRPALATCHRPRRYGRGRTILVKCRRLSGRVPPHRRGVPEEQARRRPFMLETPAMCRLPGP